MGSDPVDLPSHQGGARRLCGLRDAIQSLVFRLQQMMQALAL